MDSAPNDLWTAMTKAATEGHPGPNHGRIFEGQLYVTAKEWNAIGDGPATKKWDNMHPVERLATIPIRIIPNGSAEKFTDGSVLIAFADNLYLLREADFFNRPPLPKLCVN